MSMGHDHSLPGIENQGHSSRPRGSTPKKTKPGRDYVFSLVPVSQLSEVAAERFVVQAE